MRGARDERNARQPVRARRQLMLMLGASTVLPSVAWAGASPKSAGRVAPLNDPIIINTLGGISNPNIEIARDKANAAPCSALGSIAWPNSRSSVCASFS